MSWKKIFVMGLVATLLSSSASIIYQQIYKAAFFVDFSVIVGQFNIVAACAMGCLLMGLGYKMAIIWKGDKLIPWLHIVYSILSFASIAPVLGFNLPLEIESPEMFPGLVVPMHFFPILSITSIFPLFKTANDETK